MKWALPHSLRCPEKDIIYCVQLMPPYICLLLRLFQGVGMRISEWLFQVMHLFALLVTLLSTMAASALGTHNAWEQVGCHKLGKLILNCSWCPQFPCPSFAVIQAYYHLIQFLLGEYKGLGGEYWRGAYWTK